MTIAVIHPRQLAALRDAGERMDLIDVRTPAEFQEVHVEGARNIPLDRLDASALMRSRAENDDQPLYLICHSGSRGRQACERLLKAGVTQPVNVEGGTKACVEAGLPVVRGPRVMWLERQVRITAGSLVLLGLGMGWMVHPAFLVLSAFVGAGLVFSGVTDTCGTGTVLARMPWNRRVTPHSVA